MSEYHDLTTIRRDEPTPTVLALCDAVEWMRDRLTESSDAVSMERFPQRTCPTCAGRCGFWTHYGDVHNDQPEVCATRGCFWTTTGCVNCSSDPPGEPMSAREELLDLVGPFRGECGICGGPDARHRMVDAIAGMARAGDSVEGIADDYGLPVDSVARLKREWHVWFVTSGRGIKRIHREGCMYGKSEYLWAFGKDDAELTGELIGTGSYRWHRGCRVCCPEIDDVLHPLRETPCN